MKISTRYLTKEIYTAMLATAVVLMVIFLSNQLVRFMHSAASGDLAGSAIKILLLLELPILSAVILPASLFLGILLAYGRLYADSEMVVLSACGFSSWRLLKITINFSIIIMLFVAGLSLWFNPKMYKYLDHMTRGGTVGGLEMVKTNHFNEIVNGKWIFYAEEISEDKKSFYNIFASLKPDSSGKDNGDLCVVSAKSARQKIDHETGDAYILLTDGYRYIGNPGNKNYEVIKYDEYAIQSQKDVKPWYSDASSTPTLKLWKERKDKLAAAELQWRISLPLSVIILALIGVPLSRVKPRGGKYAKLAPAVLIYIIYANFLFLTKAWVKRGVLIPELGMWWVHGLMFLFASFLIFKQTRWWRGLKL